MTKRRVVVTGLGMLTPLGLDVKSTWDGIVAGKSGISDITEVDTTDFAVKFAGTIPTFDPTVYITSKDLKKMDICLQYGVAASLQAWQDAGIDIEASDADRIGVSMGSGIGGITNMEKSIHAIANKGPRRVSPFFIPSSIINMVSGNVAIKLGLKGPNISIVTACTTGTHNIGYAARSIQYGDADVMIAGGTEKASCTLGICGFAAARALSRRNDNPQAASRPWDKDRDGFVLGDGAGALVLEEYEHAKNRNAKIYAEITGFGVSCDAYHITLPNIDGPYKAMEKALKDASISAKDIDYINAHGTSTPVGDINESRAVEKLLSSVVNKPPMSSTKSMTGHLLGATGAVEAIFSILSLRDQVIPPTINLDNVDEGCNLDYVPHTARRAKLDVVLSNSFGFGGTNGSLIFKKV